MGSERARNRVAVGILTAMIAAVVYGAVEPTWKAPEAIWPIGSLAAAYYFATGRREAPKP